MRKALIAWIMSHKHIEEDRSSRRGDMFKPRGQIRGGEGGCSNDHNTSVNIRGEGVKIAQNFVFVVCTRPQSSIARALTTTMSQGIAFNGA